MILHDIWLTASRRASAAQDARARTARSSLQQPATAATGTALPGLGSGLAGLADARSSDARPRRARLVANMQAGDGLPALGLKTSTQDIHHPQVNSALALGVSINRDTSVRAGGGYLIQLLPFASEETLVRGPSSPQELTHGSAYGSSCTKAPLFPCKLLLLMLAASAKPWPRSCARS